MDLKRKMLAQHRGQRFSCLLSLHPKAENMSVRQCVRLQHMHMPYFA